MATEAEAGLAQDFERISTFLRRGGSPQQARQHLVDLARASIDRCDWACLTQRPAQAPPRTLTSSDPVAAELDHLQNSAGEGPCLEAARAEHPVWTDDIATDPRWPVFGRLAAADGRLHAVLSFHLIDEPAPTALNLYSASRDGFDDDAVATATLFAIHATTMMAHAASAHLAQTLGGALTTSRQIGMAIGILMRAHRITEERAFEMLRTTSSALNRKLRDVAEEVTHRGELPEDPAGTAGA